MKPIKQSWYRKFGRITFLLVCLLLFSADQIAAAGLTAAYSPQPLQDRWTIGLVGFLVVLTGLTISIWAIFYRRIQATLQERDLALQKKNEELAQEIEARRQAEKALQEQHQLMDYIIRHDPNAIAVYDNNLRYIFVSDRYKQDYKVGDRDIIGLHHYEVFPEIPLRWREIHQRVLAGTIEQAEEDYFVRPDGSVDYNRWECRPWYKANGEIGGMITYTEVITEHKKLEEELTTIFNMASDLICIADINTATFTKINPAFEKLLGYSEEELLGQPFLDFIHPDDLEPTVEVIQEKLQLGVSVISFENRYRCKDGTYRYLNWNSNPMPEKGLTYAIAHDITERKQAEQALREGEEKFRTLVENIEEVFWIRDLRTERLIYLSPGYEKIWERSGQSAYENPSSFIDAVHPDDKSRVRQMYRRSLEGPITMEYRIVLPDRSVRWVAVRTFCTTTELGELERQIGVAQDITERKQAEESLRESEQRYRTLFEKTANPIFVIDTEGNYVDCNEAALQFAECSYRELLTKNIRDFVVPGEEDVIEEHKHLWQEGGRIETDYYIQNQIKTVDLTITPGIWQGQAIIFGIGADITERRRAEEQIKRALKEKEVLLRELYHRTKNNMHVICSMLALRAAHVKDEYALSVLKEIEDRIQSMALVHQKLYQSQNLSSIDLKEYIGDLVALLMESYKSQTDRVSLVLDLENVPVLIDIAIPCGLILNELISNALRHAFPEDKKGAVKVRLRKREDNTILLQVSDDGIGVPPGFDFRQRQSLGLQTIFALAEYQLQGEVTFESGEGVSCQIQFQDTLYEPRI